MQTTTLIELDHDANPQARLSHVQPDNAPDIYSLLIRRDGYVMVRSYATELEGRNAHATAVAL